jgi:hypothetical protein
MTNPAFARSHKADPAVYRFFLRLNRACIDQRADRQPTPRRYATVTITPLNGGTGAVHKNFATGEEFERAYFAAWGHTGFTVPDRGCGGIGNGIFNWSWKIFG